MKKYQTPELSLLCACAKDVITASDDKYLLGDYDLPIVRPVSGASIDDGSGL